MLQFTDKTKTPAAWRQTGDAVRKPEVIPFLAIIPVNRLQEKRLQKLMGDDYFTKPALRLILSKLEGVRRVEDMDNGQSVEWNNLETERERKIAITYFWRGVDQAQKWRREGIL